jgi:hypothetical protein
VLEGILQAAAFQALPVKPMAVPPRGQVKARANVPVQFYEGHILVAGITLAWAANHRANPCCQE